MVSLCADGSAGRGRAWSRALLIPLLFFLQFGCALGEDSAVRTFRVFVYNASHLAHLVQQDCGSIAVKSKSPDAYFLRQAMRLGGTEVSVGAARFRFESAVSPADAHMSVLPLFLPTIASGRCSERVVQEMLRLAAEVYQSPWFQLSGGSDHVVLTTYFKVHHLVQGIVTELHGVPIPDFLRRMLRAVVALDRYLSGQELGCIVPVLHAPKPTLAELPPPSFEEGDWRARSWDVAFIAQSDSRHTYHWREVLFADARLRVLEPPATAANHSAGGARPAAPHSSQPPHLRVQSDQAQGASPVQPDVTMLLARAHCSAAQWREIGACMPQNRARPPVRTAVASNLTVSLTHCCAREGEYDVLMRRTRYGLHVRGDDLASARVADTLRTGGIPLVLGEGFWQRVAPVQCFVPYARAFSRVCEREFVQCGPVCALAQGYRHAMARVPPAEALQLLREHSRTLLWDLPDSTALAHALLDASRRCLDAPLLQLKRLQSPAGEEGVITCPHPDRLLGGRKFENALFTDASWLDSQGHPLQPTTGRDEADDAQSGGVVATGARAAEVVVELLGEGRGRSVRVNATATDTATATSLVVSGTNHAHDGGAGASDASAARDALSHTPPRGGGATDVGGGSGGLGGGAAADGGGAGGSNGQGHAAAGTIDPSAGTSMVVLLTDTTVTTADVSTATATPTTTTTTTTTTISTTSPTTTSVAGAGVASDGSAPPPAAYPGDSSIMPSETSPSPPGTAVPDVHSPSRTPLQVSHLLHLTTSTHSLHSAHPTLPFEELDVWRTASVNPSGLAALRSSPRVQAPLPVPQGSLEAWLDAATPSTARILVVVVAFQTTVIVALMCVVSGRARLKLRKTVRIRQTLVR